MPCEDCLGTGRRLEHAPSCDDDLCALNGDMHSCAGELVPCWCALGRRGELSPGLRRCYWLAHPGSQRRRFAEQVSMRHRSRWTSLGPWAYASLRIRLRRRRGHPHAGLLRRLLAEPVGV